MIGDVLVVLAAFAAGAATAYYVGVYRKQQRVKQQHSALDPVTPAMDPAGEQHAGDFRRILWPFRSLACWGWQPYRRRRIYSASTRFTHRYLSFGQLFGNVKFLF